MRDYRLHCCLCGKRMQPPEDTGVCCHACDQRTGGAPARYCCLCGTGFSPSRQRRGVWHEACLNAPREEIYGPGNEASP
jgi:hypothetical protein